MFWKRIYVLYLNLFFFCVLTEKDFENLHIPVGGDQLTRVRLHGAKTLRLGSHTRDERFDCLHPIIIELFHTLMDFLEVLVHTVSIW